LKETGVVIELVDSRAKVAMPQTRACKNCNLCLMHENTGMVTEAWNNLGAKVGDRVCVHVPDRGRITGTFVLFLVPVLALLLGLVLGLWAAEQLGLRQHASLGAGIAAVIFLIPSFFLVRWYDRRLALMYASEVRIVDILSKTS
jgi:sigma-E factor negative regulatory protein RseC